MLPEVMFYLHKVVTGLQRHTVKDSNIQYVGHVLLFNKYLLKTNYVPCTVLGNTLIYKQRDTIFDDETHNRLSSLKIFNNSSNI